MFQNTVYGQEIKAKELNQVTLTRLECIQMLLKSLGYDFQDNNQLVINKAIELNLISSHFMDPFLKDLNTHISRQEASRILYNAYFSHESIIDFRTRQYINTILKDSHQIMKINLRGVLLTYGLNLFDTDNFLFFPDKLVRKDEFNDILKKLNNPSFEILAVEGLYPIQIKKQVIILDHSRQDLINLLALSQHLYKNHDLDMSIQENNILLKSGKDWLLEIHNEQNSNHYIRLNLNHLLLDKTLLRQVISYLFADDEDRILDLIEGLIDKSDTSDKAYKYTSQSFARTFDLEVSDHNATMTISYKSNTNPITIEEDTIRFNHVYYSEETSDKST